MVDFSAAHLMASSACESGNVLVIYFWTRNDETPSFVSLMANNRKASSIGPHRDPTTRSSSMTKGAALNCSPAAQVLLSTNVPMGRHNPAANFNPAGLPVASTTTSNFPAYVADTPLNAVSSWHSCTNFPTTPLSWTNCNLCSCLPNRMGAGGNGSNLFWKWRVWARPLYIHECKCIYFPRNEWQ